LINQTSNAQSFGCYDVEIPTDNYYAFSTSSYSNVEEAWFNLPNLVKDGEYTVFHPKSSSEDSLRRIKVKGFIKDGLQNGKWIAVSEGGKDSIIGNYWQGKKNGVWKFYKESEGGATYLKRNVLYLDGLIDSFDVQFNANGDTVEYTSYNKGMKQGINYKLGKYSAIYDNNMLNGKVVVFHSAKRPFYEMTYKNNLPFTLHYVINICGDTIDNGSFKNGNGKLIFYDKELGLPESIFTFNNQLISGDMIHYNSNRSVFEKGLLYTENDKYIVKDVNLFRTDYNLQAAYQLKFIYPTNYNVFYSSGKIKESIIGLKNSEYTAVKSFDENGNIVASHIVYGGITVGDDTSFYENGKIKSIIPYQIDSSAGRLTKMKQGRAIFFYNTGQLKAELNFQKDKEMGKSIYYNESREIVKEHFIFANGSSFSIFYGDTTNRVDSLGRKQGKWFRFFTYSCSNSPNQVEFYLDGKPTGEWLDYSYNGVLFSKTTWIDADSLYAYCKVFYQNGKVAREGYQYNSFDVGYWRFYHEKGWLSHEGELTWEGKKGNWVYYNRRGKVKKVVKH
jgi:antitoxin component YwqK of YwqJK toxin-antitoxin module